MSLPEAYATRSPHFAENVVKSGYGDDTVDELYDFSCPFCGHITPDHSWSPPSTCLVEGCECKGWESFEGSDDMLMANTGEIFHGGPGPDYDQCVKAIKAARNG
jgi:hypothetical protein